MTRRLPIVPTILVIAAVALMIGLGFWQIRRAGEKERLIARYAAADKMPPIAWPTIPTLKDKLPLFRHATGMCQRPVGRRAIVGENLAGEPGYAQIVDCATGAEGPGMSVELGWSKNPNAAFTWKGGPVSGIVGPDRKAGMRLVAETPPAGLERSAPPSLATIPNNHRSYAVQWFAFAAIALLIYGLALRKRLSEPNLP